MKLAFDDRDAFYGDPDFSKIPGDRLLSAEYAATNMWSTPAPISGLICGYRSCATRAKS